MGCHYSREITGAIPDIHFGDEKKHPYLKEVLENKKKKLSGFFLLNRKKKERHDYVVLEKGKVVNSSKSTMIGRKATIKDGKWKLQYDWGYTRLYYPICNGKPLEIFQGSPRGKINGFFLGPNGPSGDSLHYGPGGVYIADGGVKELKNSKKLKMGKTVSILIDGFPLLVEKQDDASVRKLLIVAKNDLGCESYSRLIALQLSLYNCPNAPTRPLEK